MGIIWVALSRLIFFKVAPKLNKVGDPCLKVNCKKANLQQALALCQFSTVLCYSFFLSLSEATLYSLLVIYS